MGYGNCYVKWKKIADEIKNKTNVIKNGKNMEENEF